MEEDWQDVVLQKDCLFSSAATGAHLSISGSGPLLPQSEQLTLTLLDSVNADFKTEPIEDTSDYHGSTSGSPTSTLSSADFKEPLGLDLSLCGPFASSLVNSSAFGVSAFSPTSSLGSPFPGSSMYSSSLQAAGLPQSSPLPPVSHFSHNVSGSFNPNSHNLNNHLSQGYFITTAETFERSPSPPSDRSSPMNTPPYDAMPGTLQSSNLLHNGGGPIHGHPLKIRSKMHEMAVKQKLITDQDPRGEGTVQLSPEEKRTLIQEGFAVPTKLPLTKSEEEALKMVRRKIKNKLSAQESRRKRKEYMDSLESRCQAYHNENAQLRARLRYLEQLNKQLMERCMESSNSGNSECQADSPIEGC